MILKVIFYDAIQLRYTTKDIYIYIYIYNIYIYIYIYSIQEKKTFTLIYFAQGLVQIN